MFNFIFTCNIKWVQMSFYNGILYYQIYNGFKYGDWSPTRIRLAPGRITNDGSDLEQQGSE